MTFRRMALVGLVVAVLASVAAGLAIRSLRALPDWYAAGVAEADAAPAEPEPEPGGLVVFLGGLFGIETRHAATLMDQLQELALTGRVALDAGRLAAVIETSMSTSADGRATLASLTQPLARIGDGRIEYGGRVDLDHVDESKMSESAREVVHRLRDWMPALRGREIYVGLRAVPRAVDGDLHLSHDAALIVGRLAIPAWMIPAPELRQQLDIDLRLLELTRAEVEENRLVLETGQAAR